MSNQSSQQHVFLNVRDLIPGGKRASWAHAAGLSSALLDSIAIRRRSLTEATTKALAAAARVPEAWVPAMIDATRRS